MYHLQFQDSSNIIIDTGEYENYIFINIIKLIEYDDKNNNNKYETGHTILKEIDLNYFIIVLIFNYFLKISKI